MSQISNDLFGDKHITIKGDSYLTAIAQHIYDLIQLNPNLINGDSTNQINRQIHLALMFDSGLMAVLKSGDKEQFSEWYLSRKCPTEEETARAVRALVEADHIRLAKSVITKSEQFKARIASKMRG